MRIRLWLRRLRGIRIKGFRRKPLTHHPVNVPKTTTIQNSPHHTASNSIAKATTIVHLSPANFRGSNSVSPRMLSPSPISPLPSPALVNTPTAASVLFAKDITIKQGAPAPNSQRTSRKIAQVVASLGCGSSYRNARKDLPSRNSDKMKSEKTVLEKPNAAGTKKNPVQTSAGKKWAGACKCMLVNVENELTRRRRKVIEEDYIEGLPIEKKLVFLDKNGEANLIISKSIIKGSVDKSAPRNSGEYSKDLKDQRVFLDKNGEANLIISKSIVKGLVDKSSSRNSEEYSKDVKDHNTSDKVDSKSRNPRYENPAHSRASSSWSNERSTVTTDDNVFTSIEKGRPSGSSVSSFDVSDKLSGLGFSDTTAAASVHSSINAAEGGQPRSWQGDDGNQNVARRSHRSTFSIESLYSHSNHNTQSEMDEEEEALLQADSYASSDNLSVASCSPYWPGQTDFDPFNALVDVEASAKAWGTDWVVSSENGVQICAPMVDMKQGISVPRRKDKRGDASALRRKYRAQMYVSGREMIVLPCEVTRKGSGVDVGHDPNLKEGIQRRPPVVGDSLAVEKRSQDPYIDFRDSMVDVILQNQLYKASDLEELLQCFLSLNAIQHHDVIVEAFTEVWEKVFGGSVRSPMASSVQ